MPSYAHLTQFSATDPLPLTLGPVVRPPTPAPAPCPLQAFERGDHGRARAQLAAQSVQEHWRPKVGDLVDTDCGPVLRGAKVLVCRPDDTCATVGSPSGVMAFLVPKSALRPAVTPVPAAPPAGRQQIRVAWPSCHPTSGWGDDTPAVRRTLEA